MDLNILYDYGIDCEKGIARCIGDRDFYTTILKLFVNDTSFTRMSAAYNKKDAEELFACAHELKGACGNAALTELYDAICPLVDLLRADKSWHPELTDMFTRIETAYVKALTGLKLFLGEE